MSDARSPKDLYRYLEPRLEPHMDRLGLQRVKAGPPWLLWKSQAADGDAHVFYSLQADAKATDAYAGGGFRIQLEKSSAKRPGGVFGCAFFFQLLSDAEMDGILKVQNSVIRSFPPPPQEWIETYAAQSLDRQYLSWFDPQSDFNPIDCWFRYRTTEDLDAWVLRSVRSLSYLSGGRPNI